MADAPDTLFPLIRHLSVRVTPLLARLPLSANQITFISLLVGLGCAMAMTQQGRTMAMAGAGMLFLCYVLDNCDGEIARLKNQCTAFGAFFDTFVDWVVHAAFFAALGVGVTAATENDLWLWLGAAAAAGSTINYAMVLVDDWRRNRAGHDFTSGDGLPSPPPRPLGWRQRTAFILRELFRADFCFIVLALAFFDALWLLLPLGAVGAQAYWAAQLIKGVRDYHV